MAILDKKHFIVLKRPLYTFLIILSKSLSFFLAGFVLVVLLTLSSCSQNNEDTEPESVQGYLDLSEWDFDTKSTYVLKGDWAFYWNQLPKDSIGNFDSGILKNPESVIIYGNSTWKNLGYPAKGYGTYRLKIKLPKTKNEKAIGLKTLRVKSACEIWANSKKLDAYGKVAKNESEDEGSGKTILVELPNDEVIDLVIPISNYIYSYGGGIKTDIQIAPIKTLQARVKRNSILESAIVSIMFIAGLFQLTIYFFKRKRAFLFLSLLCFSSVLRQLALGEVILYNFFPDMSFSFVQKSRYIGFYGGILSMTYYVKSIIPQYMKKWLVTTMTYPNIFGIIFVLLVPVNWTTRTGGIFQLLGLLLAIYLFYVAIRLFQSKQVLHNWLLFSFVITFVFIGNDFLLAQGLLNTSYLGGYSILVFILVQSVINYLFQNDIERKQELMELMIAQKELMLKEVHHRVKNNFQIVSSLLELQAKDITDEKAQRLANDGQNRLKSMAYIHQKLYQSATGTINFNDYLKKLVQEISMMFQSGNNVHITIQAEAIELDIDTAMPLGLIVNEIITNAYKYAFKGIVKPTLNISIAEAQQNNYMLEISDNGIGLDEKIDIKKAKSIGLRLVRGLVKQLNGTMNVCSNNGTTFKINFINTVGRKLIE